MDSVVKRRARREQLALSQSELEQMQLHNGSQIVSPVVTRRPEIDSMMGTMAFIAEWALENWRTKIVNKEGLDRKELRDFRETCETVLRQAKTEMEIEKHVAARTSAMSAEEISRAIQLELTQHNIDEDVVQLVLTALGLSQTTSKSPSQTWASDLPMQAT